VRFFLLFISVLKLIVVVISKCMFFPRNANWSLPYFRNTDRTRWRPTRQANNNILRLC